MFNSLLADYAFDAAEPVAIWLTVAIVAAMIVAGVVLFFAKRGVFVKYVKYGVLAFVAYALVLGLTMLILQLVKRTNPAYLEDKWLNADVINFVLVPLVAVFGFVLLSGVGLFIISQKKRGLLKPLLIAFASVAGAGVIAAGVAIGIYYARHIVDDGYYSEYTDQLGLYISAAALIVAEVVAVLVFGRKEKTRFDSRSIALAGICVAMSFVLSYVKLVDLPFGGSITLVSLFPIMIYAYAYGVKKGFIIGLIYGLMQAMQDPYIIHPAQFLLDYPVAFSFVAFAGAFKNVGGLKFPQVKFALGALVAGALRFTAHLFSGVFAFGANGVDVGFVNLWIYSATYNAFVFIDIALVIVAGVLVLSSKTFVKQIESYAAEKKKETAAEPQEAQEEK